MRKRDTKNKRISLQNLISIIIIFFILTLTNSVKAQPDSGRDPDSAPVDGGLSVIVAAGVGFAVKQLRRKRNNPEE